MQVFDKVMDQAQSIGLPVMAVALTAVSCPNTPVLLMVHWHGFARPQTPRHVQTSAIPADPVGIPGSVLQVNDTWLAMEHLDNAMLQAAWQFGAWDLLREERRGCNTAGASDQEALECRQAFAENPFDGPADDYMLTQAPDRSELMQWGAQRGYVRWQFHPVKNGLWSNSGGDESLLADGSRRLPCPVAAKPAVGTRVRQTRYRLGQSNRIVLV